MSLVVGLLVVTAVLLWLGRNREAPMPVLIEECWRLIGPSNKPLTCAIYAGPAGRVEVRCFYSDSPDFYGDSPDDLLRSELAPDVDGARDIAATWKHVATDKGFIDLTNGQGRDPGREQIPGGQNRNAGPERSDPRSH